MYPVKGSLAAQTPQPILGGQIRRPVFSIGPVFLLLKILDRHLNVVIVCHRACRLRQVAIFTSGGRNSQTRVRIEPAILRQTEKLFCPLPPTVYASRNWE